MITTEIIKDTDQFRDMESEWNDLLRDSSCNCLFLTWEWMYTWWLHLGGNRKLHIIAVRLDGLLIAMAPLALCPPRIRRLMPFRVLEFLGSGDVGSDHLNVVVRRGHEEGALPEIARSLAKSSHVLELVRVNSASPIMENMTRQLRLSDWEAVSLTTTHAPYATLSGHSWESYLFSLDKGHRETVARKLRKLHKDFTVELKTAVTDSERQNALELLVRLHLERWSKREGSTAFDEQELIRFHQAFSKISLNLGWLQLYTLMLDGDAAAVIYLFKYDHVSYFYQAAFNADYQKYSPGMIILALAIKNSIAEGVLEFDFLHDDEAYKYRWTRERRELVRFEFYPPHAVGRLPQRVRLMKLGIKHLLRGLTFDRDRS